MDNTFVDQHAPTIGAEFFRKDVEVEGQRVQIQFWDTSGQELFKSMATSFYKNGHAAILVYSVASRKTFENIQYWLKEVRDHADSNVKIFLLGNKIDLKDAREVSLEEGQEFAKEHGLFFMEVSALTNENDCMAKALEMISKEIHHNAKSVQWDQSKTQGKQTELILSDSITERVQERRGDCCSR